MKNKKTVYAAIFSALAVWTLITLAACTSTGSRWSMDAATYYNWGNAAIENGDYDKAIYYYTQAIRFEPTHAEIYNNRGIAYIKKQDYDPAIADFNEALRLNPNFAEAFNNRGIAYREKGDHEKAITDYTESIRLNPNFAEAFCNRGIIYAEKGDIDSAIADFNNAVRISPNNTAYKEALLVQQIRSGNADAVVAKQNNISNKLLGTWLYEIETPKGSLIEQTYTFNSDGSVIMETRRYGSIQRTPFSEKMYFLRPQDIDIINLYSFSENGNIYFINSKHFSYKIDNGYLII